MIFAKRAQLPHRAQKRGSSRHRLHNVRVAAEQPPKQARVRLRWQVVLHAVDGVECGGPQLGVVAAYHLQLEMHLVQHGVVCSIAIVIWKCAEGRRQEAVASLIPKPESTDAGVGILNLPLY